MSTKITRRDAVLGIAGGVAAMSVSSRTTALHASESAEALKGNINHSVSRWCYGKISLDDLCKACQRIGIKSVELVGPDDWPTLQKYGLTCAMTSAGLGIDKGFNRLEYHDKLVAGLERLAPMAAAAGMPNIICMSGNRQGMDDDEGMKNCEIGLKRIVGAVRETQSQPGHGTAQQQSRSCGLHVRSHELGRRACARRSAPNGSSCCTTSITCRSWKAT